MSGVGVVQEESEDREYYLQVFYISPQSDLSNCKIHVVITWNVEAHLTVSVIKS